MGHASIARDVVRAHRNRDITTEDALTMLVSMLGDDRNTEFINGVIHRAITLVTGIPIVKVEHVDPPQTRTVQ